MNTNEQASESCPFCGAGKKRHLPHIAFRWFECGTMTAPAKTPRRDQTPACADAERERLTRERDVFAMQANTLVVKVDQLTAKLNQSMLELDQALMLLGVYKTRSGDLLARVKRLEEESESRWLLAQSAIGSCTEMSSRVQRLEEAGDAMAMSPCCCVCDGPCEHVPLVESWNAAKESKP